MIKTECVISFIRNPHFYKNKKQVRIVKLDSNLFFFPILFKLSKASVALKFTKGIFSKATDYAML